MFYDIIRILKTKRPKAFLLENVKNLKSYDKGRTFIIISEILKELDYITFDQIIDANHYVPQHRERIFIAGFNREHYNDSIIFKFPETPKKEMRVHDILVKNPDPKYTLTDHLWSYLQNYAKKHKKKETDLVLGL